MRPSSMKQPQVSLADLYNEKAGIFDDEDDGEVDLASQAFGVWQNGN